MRTTTHRFGWYLAALQLFFALCWTVYALYLPQLAAIAGIAAGAIVLILMLDQAVFTVCNFLTGIATGRVTRTLGRIGPIVAAVTVISCVAFVALATFPRMAAVAMGTGTDPALKAVLEWVPVLCWAVAGAALLYRGFAGLQRWAVGDRRRGA